MTHSKETYMPCGPLDYPDLAWLKVLQDFDWGTRRPDKDVILDRARVAMSGFEGSYAEWVTALVIGTCKSIMSPTIGWLYPQRTGFKKMAAEVRTVADVNKLAGDLTHRAIALESMGKKTMMLPLCRFLHNAAFCSFEESWSKAAISAARVATLASHIQDSNAPLRVSVDVAIQAFEDTKPKPVDCVIVANTSHHFRTLKTAQNSARNELTDEESLAFCRAKLLDGSEIRAWGKLNNLSPEQVENLISR